MAGKHVLYRSLGTLLQSGLTITQALEALEETAPNHYLRSTVKRVYHRLREGDQLFEAMQQTGGRFTRFEIALIKAGEKAGVLDEALKKLADVLEMEQQLKWQVVFGLAYPGFLIHAAVLLPPLYILIQTGPEAYAGTVLPVLGALWGFIALVAGINWLGQWVNLVGLLLDGVKLHLPLVGTITRRFIWSRFLWTLEACYSAGITPRQALETAGRACRNRFYEHQFLRAAEGIDEELTIAETISAHTSCPRELRTMIATGEQGGALEDMLQRGARMYQQRGEEALQRLVKALPVVIFLLVAGYIAMVVIRFWSTYFSQLGI